MKKLVLMIAMISAFAGSSVAATRHVNLYSSGSDNVKRTWEAVIKKFERKYPDIHVDLEFQPSGTVLTQPADRIIAAKKANRSSGIDLIDADELELMKIQEQAGLNALAPIHKKQVPNLSIVTAKQSAAKGHAIPFRGTTVVLAYNKDTVKHVPSTVNEMYQWIKSHPRKFAYTAPGTGGSGDSMLITTVYNYLPEKALYSSDMKWSKQWGKGFAKLKQLHPYLYKSAGKVLYPFKNQGTIDLLANGIIDMAPMWADMILDQKSRGLIPDNIMITQIKPAFTGGLVSLALTADSKHKAAAYQFINYVVSPEAQDTFVREQKAIPVIANSNLSSQTLHMLSGLKMTHYRSYAIGDLYPELVKSWSEKIAVLSK